MILFLLALLAGFCRPAYADNNCWAGADYTSAAKEDSHVVIGTGGAISSFLPARFCQAAVTNNSASTVWAMVFDSATLPANGTKPKLEWNVATNTTNGEFGYGMQMNTGVVIACSSTEASLTVTVASSCFFHVTVAH